MDNTDIIIANYATEDLAPLALACLQSIRAYTEGYRIIFVDNGSPRFDLMAEELERHPHLLIRNTVNLGFVRASNLGLMSATAPYVVLMNNDTEAVDGWLEALRSPLKDPDVGISGPLTTTPNSWQGKAPEGEGFRILPPGHMLAFFCTMFRREVFDRVGLLDESYGVGLGDDDDFCRRAEAAGFSLALVHSLRIPHHHRSTFRALYTTEEIASMQDAAMRRLHEEVTL